MNDKVSVGFGLNWQRMEAEYLRSAAIASAALAATHATLDVSNDAWGWNVGALFDLSPSTRVGVSYRSAIKHELDGDLRVSGPAAGANAALTTGKASVDVELPDTFVLSVVQQLDPRWEMLGDVSWTGWSKIDKLDIVRTSGALTGATVQTLDTDFRDTWRIALGANYRLDDAWKLKFGVAYDQTPVKSAATRLVSLPDSNRTWLTVGGQWKADKVSTLDLGVAYLYVPEPKINNDQLAAGRGTVTGVYDARGGSSAPSIRAPSDRCDRPRRACCLRRGRSDRDEFYRSLRARRPRPGPRCGRAAWIADLAVCRWLGPADERGGKRVGGAFAWQGSIHSAMRTTRLNFGRWVRAPERSSADPRTCCRARHQRRHRIMSDENTNIAVTPSAYAYPLLIKQLLHTREPSRPSRRSSIPTASA